MHDAKMMKEIIIRMWRAEGLAKLIASSGPQLATSTRSELADNPDIVPSCSLLCTPRVTYLKGSSWEDVCPIVHGPRSIVGGCALDMENLANMIRRGLIHDSASEPVDFSGPHCIFPFRSSAFHEPCALRAFARPRVFIVSSRLGLTQ